MEFSIVLNQATILSIISLIGYMAGKYGIIDEAGSKKLSEVLLFITSPMMVLRSFFIEFSKARLINILWMVGSSALMFIISIALAQIIYRNFNSNIRPVMRTTAVFSNCAYMGLPLISAFWGDEGVFFGSFYIVVFHTFLWSYGYAVYGAVESKVNMVKNVLTKPSLIALYLGLLIFFSKIPVPDVINSAVSIVGSVTMPLSMLIIGGIISRTKFSTLFNDWRVYLVAVIRLIFMPFIAFLLAYLAKIPPLPASVMIIAISMPVAANIPIFAEKFGKDSSFASKCVTISTLFSIFTSPVIIYVVAALL
ncbi:MAG: AEC family transporter [Acetivibrionales bacterium]